MQRDHVRQRSRWYGTAFSPLSLFFGGANGAWYDPSDYSTMFQNAAGTTPVTAVGQPVGLMLDKSGRSNHAYNPSGNSANFPALSARYNLLTKTEDFNQSPWSGAVVSTAQSLGGGVWRLVGFDGAAGTRISQTISSAPLIAYKSQIEVKGESSDIGKDVQVILIRSGGTIIQSAAVVTLTGEWQTVNSQLTLLSDNTGVELRLGRPSSNFASAPLVRFPDLRVANDALNQPAYQRVNTATDYGTVGFKPYLSFNGVNQWLQTNSIDFTYGDKMFVSAGVRKLSDAALGTVVGLTTGIASNNGAFRLAAPGSAAPNLAWSAKGTTQVDLTSTTYAAPITSIVSGTADISGPSTIQRINGAQTASSASSLGTGNFSNAALYLGASGSTANWLNGRLYGLVVAGKQASASEIASTEAWLNSKTGAY